MNRNAFAREKHFRLILCSLRYLSWRGFFCGFRFPLRMPDRHFRHKMTQRNILYVICPDMQKHRV